MLDKLKKLKDAVTNTMNQAAFDPSRFDDPLAMSIQWTPIKGGGTNFRTHKFYKQDANQVGFKATIGAKLFSGIFMAVGIAVAVGITWMQVLELQQKNGQSVKVVMLLIYVLSFLRPAPGFGNQVPSAVVFCCTRFL